MALYAGHTGVVVQDLERVAQFYVDVLGLSETRRVEREGRPLDALLGLTNVRLEVVFLGTPDRPAALELLKYVRHPSAPVPRNPNTHGVNHVHFVTDDLDPMLERLAQRQVEHVGGPVAWFDTWTRVLYTRDPEGNIVEVTEIAPGQPLPYAPRDGGAS